MQGTIPKPPDHPNPEPDQPDPGTPEKQHDKPADEGQDADAREHQPGRL